jgi:hypothetical protein
MSGEKGCRGTGSLVCLRWFVFAGCLKGSAACFEQIVVVLGSTDRATIGRFA